jgi:hypothetical protein
VLQDDQVVGEQQLLLMLDVDVEGRVALVQESGHAPSSPSGGCRRPARGPAAGFYGHIVGVTVL